MCPYVLALQKLNRDLNFQSQTNKQYTFTVSNSDFSHVSYQFHSLIILTTIVLSSLQDL